MDDSDGEFEGLDDNGQSVYVGLDSEYNGCDDDDKFDPGAARGGVDDSERAPTLEDKTRLSHDIYKLKSEELGELVWKLETRCPQAIVVNKQQTDEVEINMDAIEPGTFHEARRCRSGADGGAEKNNCSNPFPSLSNARADRSFYLELLARGEGERNED